MGIVTLNNKVLISGNQMALYIPPRKITIPSNIIEYYSGTSFFYEYPPEGIKRQDYTIFGIGPVSESEPGKYYLYNCVLNDKKRTIWSDGTTTNKTVYLEIKRAPGSYRNLGISMPSSMPTNSSATIYVNYNQIGASNMTPRLHNWTGPISLTQLDDLTYTLNTHQEGVGTVTIKIPEDQYCESATITQSIVVRQ